MIVYICFWLQCSMFMQDRWCVEAEIDSDVCRCWSFFFFFSHLSGLKREPPRGPAVTVGQKQQNRSLLGGLRIPAVHLDFIGVQFSQQNAVMKCLFVRCCFVGHVRVVLCCFGCCEFPVHFQWKRGQKQNGGGTESGISCRARAEKS